MHYPVYLDLKGKTVLLVGGGEVACQKLTALLAAEAEVRVVAPEARFAIEELARAGKIRWIRRPFEAADLDGVCLIFAATDDRALQPRIAEEARRRGVWINVVDVPSLCDFIAPAVIRRGDIQVAVSTGGAAPALAGFLRRKLEPAIGDEYVRFSAIVKKLRPEILKLPKDRRRAFWERAVCDAFFARIRREGPERAETEMKSWLDAECADAPAS